MASPKSRISRSRRGKRRSHNSLKAACVTSCPRCKSPVSPHCVCLSCGFYKDKEVLLSKSS